MSDWPKLQEELDRWQNNGQVATFWWRDDDAEQPTPQLHRLLRIAVDTATPIALAVPPDLAIKALVTEVDNTVNICTVLQHGYAHINHGLPGQKKCELGIQRPIGTTLNELSAGQEKLLRLFGQSYTAVMVPPWNRIDDAVVARLSSIGFIGLSRFTPRGEPHVQGLTQCNTHVDIIDWRHTRGFAGASDALSQLIAHLQQRRTRKVDTNEPTGLLTHHLQHDEQCWQFIETLMSVASQHPAVSWLRAKDIFETAR